MNVALANALEAIVRERNSGFKEASTCVGRLLKEYAEPQIADRLFDEIPRSIPWEVVADLLGILVWITNDNGSDIARTAERWLREGSDTRKVKIALHLEAYPFIDQAEMEHVLGHLIKTNPEVAARCQELIDMRRKQGNV